MPDCGVNAKSTLKSRPCTVVTVTSCAYTYFGIEAKLSNGSYVYISPENFKFGEILQPFKNG